MKSISGIIISEFTGLNNIRLRTGASSGAIVKWGKTSLINLTATFGAGNEPTKEQCDLFFANYFEGTDNVLGLVELGVLMQMVKMLLFYN